MIGTLLNDRYRLDAILGHGGMGVVYRAHDVLLERDVAIKVLSGASLGADGRGRLHADETWFDLSQRFRLQGVTSGI